MFTYGMLSTCFSNDSTIVWTQHPLTRGLLRTIICMDYSDDHVLRTALGSQPAVIGIDRFMSITNMLRFTQCTCWLCVNYFELYMLLSNLYTRLYTMCIDFYFNVCDRCLRCLFACKSRLGKSLSNQQIVVCTNETCVVETEQFA
ncbi:hypothetical protein HanPI659440_Chr02g0082201 [Helianthus annuus]|nr:hypothetical protein HanPI659440_Chr02g0082201 [Helianthus annuus]